MEQVYHVKLGDSRRLALPAALCRQLDLKPGDELLLTPEPGRLAVTSLRHQAEQMRKDLRDMLGDGPSLTEDLKKMRQAEAEREAPAR